MFSLLVETLPDDYTKSKNMLCVLADLSNAFGQVLLLRSICTGGGLASLPFILYQITGLLMTFISDVSTSQFINKIKKNDAKHK